MPPNFLATDVLRTNASDLRAHAATVAADLNRVDRELHNLKDSPPANHLTETLRRAYEAQRQQLQDIPDLLAEVAQSLEQTAEIYDQE